VDVKVTSELMIGVEGECVKLVDGGGGAVIVIVLELVTVCGGDDESVAVSVTV